MAGTSKLIERVVRLSQVPRDERAALRQQLVDGIREHGIEWLRSLARELAYLGDRERSEKRRHDAHETTETDLIADRETSSGGRCPVCGGAMPCEDCGLDNLTNWATADIRGGATGGARR